MIIVRCRSSSVRTRTGGSRAAMIGDNTILLSGKFVHILVQVEDAVREIGPRQESRQDGHKDNKEEENKTRRLNYSTGHST